MLNVKIIGNHFLWYLPFNNAYFFPLSFLPNNILIHDIFVRGNILKIRLVDTLFLRMIEYNFTHKAFSKIGPYRRLYSPFKLEVSIFDFGPGDLMLAKIRKPILCLEYYFS